MDNLSVGLCRERVGARTSGLPDGTLIGDHRGFLTLLWPSRSTIAAPAAGTRRSSRAANAPPAPVTLQRGSDIRELGHNIAYVIGARQCATIRLHKLGKRRVKRVPSAVKKCQGTELDSKTSRS